MSSLRPNVLAAKERLAAGHAAFQQRHNDGCPGMELCAAISDLRDAVLVDLTEAALVDLNEAGPSGLWPEIALVAHAGYGRRDVAPYSDVDLMILHTAGIGDRVAPLAERLLRDVFDAGLIVGHSVRTADQACRMACNEPMICTSLVESRLLHGNETLFAGYKNRLMRQTHRRARWLITGIERDRQQERLRYGETVFLLEPNVKRSRGALRDIQLIRWLGLVRYGTADFRQLHASGKLHEEDVTAILRAAEFLLRLRNEMHFHASQAADVLDRADQLRISELRGYQPAAGLLPVEQFMRDYFRHTDAVSHIAARFVGNAQSSSRKDRLLTMTFGHRVENGIHVGPAGLLATGSGLRQLHGNLTAIMRLVDLANLYDAPIAAATWEAIRHEAARLPSEPPSAEACRHFLSLLAHPTRLAPLLRDMHNAGLLERFIPEFEHARGLLQFNQYHKYTVDEHCLRAVEFATELAADRGPLGRVYRSIAQKRLLHLALLIHDLGKGRLEDHREVGLQIAADAAARLALPAHEAESLRFLVHKHMHLNHLAFRRDTADEQLAVQLAVQVGSPELMQMLYVLTAADLGAVGPGVWDGWKTEVVTDLYHRTMQYLAGDSPETTVDEVLVQRRAETRHWLGGRKDEPWFAEHLDALPAAYFRRCAAATSRRRSVAVARSFPQERGWPCTGGNAVSAGDGGSSMHDCHLRSGHPRHLPPADRRIEQPRPANPLAQIHTLPDGLVLDQFWVHDPDFAGEPPAERLDQIERSLIAALENSSGEPPTFRRIWQTGSHRRVRSSRRADAGADRQQHVERLDDRRRFHPRPSGTALCGHSHVVRVGAFSRSGEDRHVLGSGGRRVLCDRSAES